LGKPMHGVSVLMDAGIDVRLILTVVGMLISVVSAAVIVKTKLAAVEEKLTAFSADVESRLRKLDQRTDRQENSIDLNQQKTSVLSNIMAPKELEKKAREIEALSITARFNSERLKKLEGIHNGKHPD